MIVAEFVFTIPTCPHGIGYVIVFDCVFITREETYAAESIVSVDARTVLVKMLEKRPE